MGEAGERFRLLPAATALLGALFLSLGPAPAHAEPGFVLAQSAAAPGDTVGFSISGTNEDATYSIEVDGEGVAEGEASDGGVSGQFTMPDLGPTSRAVTVEAQITQSDETSTRARSLQYIAVTSTADTQAGPAAAPVAAAPDTAPTPSAHAAPASQSVQQHKAPTAEAAPKRRRAGRSPRRPRRRHAIERRVTYRATGRVIRVSGRHSGNGPHSAGAGPGARFGALSFEAAAESTSGAGSKDHTQSGRRSAGPDAASGLPSFLTIPPAPAILSLATGFAGNGDGGSPAGAIALPLLGLTALTVAGGGLATRRRPRPYADREDDEEDADDQDDESLKGLIYVPGDEEIEAIGARLDPGRDLDRGRHVRWPRETAEPVAVPLAEAAAMFGPIPLAALERRAKLATRTDRKYILDAQTFERLVGELLPHYLILEIEGARAFPYDTVYFDTPAWTSYRQHIQGRRRRFKCRTRLYPTSALCFFEVKLKGIRGKTVKRKLEVAVEEHGLLTSRTLGFLECELRKSYGASAPADLAPVLRTSYRRLTLVGRTDSERLTFDFELRFAADGRAYSIRPGRILLETKTEAGRLGEANRALKQLGVRPLNGCSKYCLGVALSHPELRDNPFRRLIHHHFDPYRPARARSRS